jgi:type VI secretion system lysozyme-like protein
VTLLAEIAGAPASSKNPRDAVLADLERLCTLRRGSLLLAPDYGVDDVTFLFYSFPGGIDSWSDDLESAVTKYEPRLRNVRVLPILSDSLDLTLRIEIQALLIAGNRSAPARFAATIDPQCRLSVR